MGSTGNIYERIRASKRHTTQANETANTQAENSKTKISGSSVRWANRILCSMAGAGWAILLTLAADAIINNGKLTEWIIVKL